MILGREAASPRSRHAKAVMYKKKTFFIVANSGRISQVLGRASFPDRLGNEAGMLVVTAPPPHSNLKIMPQPSC